MGKKKEVIYSKKMIHAMTMTLRAYDRLIADPGKERKKWWEYGRESGCRLCLDDFTRSVSWKCKGCFLSDLGSRDGCVTNGMYVLMQALCKEDDEVVGKAAKKRRSEILRHLDKLGYGYGRVPIWER